MGADTDIRTVGLDDLQDSMKRTFIVHTDYQPKKQRMWDNNNDQMETDSIDSGF